jgi:hypothetical protein
MDAHRFRAAEFLLNARIAIGDLARAGMERYPCGAIVVDFVNQLDHSKPRHNIIYIGGE